MHEHPSSATQAFEFDLNLYRLAAIKKAAYRFGGQFTVHLSQPVEGSVMVELTPTTGAKNLVLRAEDFPREVLDQDLREIVAEETRAVRDILLAHTFSSVSLTDAIGDTGDFRQDPLGIGETAPPSRLRENST